MCGTTIICSIVSQWNLLFTNRRVHWGNILMSPGVFWGEGLNCVFSLFFCVLRSGHAPGQLYTYPARCWRKKRRLNILEDPRLVPIEFKIGECLEKQYIKSWVSILITWIWRKKSICLLMSVLHVLEKFLMNTRHSETSSRRPEFRDLWTPVTRCGLSGPSPASVSQQNILVSRHEQDWSVWVRS